MSRTQPFSLSKWVKVAGNGCSAAGEAVAVAAMKAGARDYLMKAKLARLRPAIERELRENDRGAAVAGRLANQGRR